MFQDMDATNLNPQLAEDIAAWEFPGLPVAGPTGAYTGNSSSLAAETGADGDSHVSRYDPLLDDDTAAEASGKIDPRLTADLSNVARAGTTLNLNDLRLPGLPEDFFNLPPGLMPVPQRADDSRLMAGPPSMAGVGTPPNLNEFGLSGSFNHFPQLLSEPQPTDDPCLSVGPSKVSGAGAPLNPIDLGLPEGFFNPLSNMLPRPRPTESSKSFPLTDDIMLPGLPQQPPVAPSPFRHLPRHSDEASSFHPCRNNGMNAPLSRSDVVPPVLGGRYNSQSESDDDSVVLRCHSSSPCDDSPELPLPPPQPSSEARSGGVLPQRDPAKPWIRINRTTQGKNKRSAKIAASSAAAAYAPLPHAPAPWDVFRYTEHGELAPGTTYSTQEIARYLLEHPLHKHRQSAAGGGKSRLRVWLQRVPADSARRYPTAASSQCRFAQCFAGDHKLRIGHFRVCFDELSAQAEAEGHEHKHDPYLNAGYVHLYCLEQHMNLPRLVRRLGPDVVRPDTRALAPHEGGNRMRLDAGTVLAAATSFLAACHARTEAALFEETAADLAAATTTNTTDAAANEAAAAAPAVRLDGTLTQLLHVAKIFDDGRTRTHRRMARTGAANPFQHHLGNLRLLTTERAASSKKRKAAEAVEAAGTATMTAVAPAHFGDASNVGQLQQRRQQLSVSSAADVGALARPHKRPRTEPEPQPGPGLEPGRRCARIFPLPSSPAAQPSNKVRGGAKKGTALS